jgi:hypothetical protein
LNWSLVPLQITPYNDAFRNAETKFILQRAYGKVGQQRALSVDVVPSPEYQRLVAYAAEESSIPKQWKTFSPKFYRRVQREVCCYCCFHHHVTLTLMI